jgi:hypothetical protein
MLLQIGDFGVLSSAAAAMAQRQSGGPNHFLLGLQAEVVDCVDLFFVILGVWSSACGTNALGSWAACRHGTRFVTISPKHHPQNIIPKSPQNYAVQHAVTEYDNTVIGIAHCHGPWRRGLCGQRWCVSKSNPSRTTHAPLWPTGQPGPAPVSARRRTVVQRLPCTLLSMQRGWTGMLRPGARWGQAAEAIARGSAVRGAAATIARRAGASKSLRACVHPCQNRMRRGCVPAGTARPTGAVLSGGPGAPGSPAQLQHGARWRHAPESSRGR